MGLLKRLRHGFKRESRSEPRDGAETRQPKATSEPPIPLSEVTEASLEVWRNLPARIRQDPSMASFQVENERLHAGEQFDMAQGNEFDDDDFDLDDGSNNGSSSISNSEFITINVTNEAGESKEIDHIKDKEHSHHTSHSHQAIGGVKGTNGNHSSTQATGSKGTNGNHSSQKTKGTNGDHTPPHVVGNQSPNNSQQQPSTSNKPHHSPSFHLPHPHVSDAVKDAHPCKKYSKIIVLFMAWFFITSLLTSKSEKHEFTKHLSIPHNRPKSFMLPDLPESNNVDVTLYGAFIPDDFGNVSSNYLTVYLQGVVSDLDRNESDKNEVTKTLTETWKVPVTDIRDFDTINLVKKHHTFTVQTEERKTMAASNGIMRIMIQSNFNVHMPVKLGYDLMPINRELGIIYASFVLIFLYVLIIWEIVHRTFAAVLASCLSIALLAALEDRPTVEEIISWIDVETILLLFSMMMIVGILCETGIFDYLAVYAYKITNGNIWGLIHCLCIITTLISAFLDNVTTVLLMAPMTVRLCEVLDLNPVPVLMAIVVHANIGGMMTPIGDPPNIIITANPYIAKHGVSFLTFTEHMSVGVVILLISTSIHFRLKFRNINDMMMHEPKEIKELRRNILVWERTAASISPFTKDANLVQETMLKKVKLLRHQLKKRMAKGFLPSDRYKRTLDDLQQEFPIKKKGLLIKSSIVMIFITTLFVIESFPEIRRLSLGWSALLGVILLLIIANKDDMDAVLSKIEWPTLLFFACMFVIMEAVERMGLITWIGRLTELAILSVSEGTRLGIALVIILWLSALTSAFVDAIPVTTMMVKVVVALAKNKTLGLPLHPLVWALAFGPSLGGNGTLVGASANILAAGIAEQHGYRFSFMDYFRLGFPIMLISVLTTTAYLLLAHVIFVWH